MSKQVVVDPLVKAVESAQRVVDSLARYIDAAQAVEDYINALSQEPKACSGCLGEITYGELNLNIRSFPETGDEVGSLASGTTVCITAFIEMPNSGIWYRVEQGWIAGFIGRVTIEEECTVPEIEWVTEDVDGTSLGLMNDQQFGDETLEALIAELLGEATGLTAQDLARAQTVTELRRALESINQCTGCTAVVIANDSIRSIPDDSGIEVGLLGGTLVVCITATARDRTWFRVANGWIKAETVRLLGTSCDLHSLPQVDVTDLGGGLELLVVYDASNEALGEFAITDQQLADLRSQLEALGLGFLAGGKWTVEQLRQAIEIVNELAIYGVEMVSPAVPWTFEDLQVVYEAVIVAVERTDKL